MIEEIVTKSWEHFEERLAETTAEWTTSDRLWPELLYRGQASSAWPLETTLERRERRNMELLRYFNLISFVKPEIEVLAGASWQWPTHNEFSKQCRDYSTLRRTLSLGDMPGIEYMAHIRHHGFPSPLLDWSRSVFVAAFFAFEQPRGTAVSIYVLSEARAGEGASRKAEIARIGRLARTHRRHFIQQSEYTLCLRFTDDQKWRFAQHDHVLTNTEHDKEFPTNFALRKFSIPSAERLKVLKLLDQHNLNAYTLYGSEESLMATLSLRELELSSTGGWKN